MHDATEVDREAFLPESSEDGTTIELKTRRDGLTLEAWLVGVYDVMRCYGGPEEGGWWYDSGDLVAVFVPEDPADIASARELAAELRGSGEYKTTGNRYSVIGGEDHDVVICAGLPDKHFPSHRPHYE